METGAVEVRSRTLISSMGSFGFCEKAFLHGDRLTPLTHSQTARKTKETTDACRVKRQECAAKDYTRYACNACKHTQYQALCTYFYAMRMKYQSVSHDTRSFIRDGIFSFFCWFVNESPDNDLVNWSHVFRRAPSECYISNANYYTIINGDSISKLCLWSIAMVS